MLPGFFGPWFVGLLFNTSRKCKKQTHLIAHTLPHLAVDYLNKPVAAIAPATTAAPAAAAAAIAVASKKKKKTSRKKKREDNEEEEDEEEEEEEEGCWVMILKIGPFEQWSNAMAFLNMWTSKTRGKTRRLERGIELFNDYKDAYNLRMWIQQVDCASSLDQFKNAPQPPLLELSPISDVFLGEHNDAGSSGGGGQNDKDGEDDANCLKIDALKAVFASQELNTIHVRAIKDVHQALTKKKKITVSSS
jgi:Ni/Co efflux regulator RcnB